MQQVAEVIQEARARARGMNRAVLKTSEQSTACPIVCSREGEPLLAIPSSAHPLLLTIDQEVTVAASADIVFRGTTQTLDEGPPLARLRRFLPGISTEALRRIQLSEVAIEGDLTLAPTEWLLPRPDWAEREDFILDHMNEDHRSEMQLMCSHFFGLTVETPQMIAADPEGMHLEADGTIRYLAFHEPANAMREVQAQIIRLTHEARDGTPPG